MKTRAQQRLDHLRSLNTDWKSVYNTYKDKYYKLPGKPKYGQTTRQPDPQHGCNLLYWIENTDAIGLRLVGYADEINDRINHTGWFTDEYQDEKYRGVVYQLPTPRRRKGETIDGRHRYVYGYDDPNNPNAAFLCFDFDASDKEEAARYSDQLAEACAEEEREFQRKDRIEQDIAELQTEIRSLREDRRLLQSQYKQAKSRLSEFPSVRHAIVVNIGKLYSRSKKAHEKITSLKEEL